MKNSRRQHNSIHGALILLIATALVKVIGAIFKIPLGQLIGGTGMGYYMSAYELYSPIYTIAMAGLPIAISKLVSAAIGEGRYNDAKSIFRVSKKAFFLTGFVGFLVMELVAYPFAMYISQDIGTVFCILVIAPSMLFCCIMACYRGYYEGLTNMYPTAVSQVIEASSKLIFGYGFSYAIIKIGMNGFYKTATVFGKAVEGIGDVAAANAYNMILPYAAAGAVGGVTLGTIGGAIYMAIKFRRSGDGITETELKSSPEAKSQRENAKLLIMFALPVVLGALAQNVAGLVDLLTVQRQITKAIGTSLETVLSSHQGALSSISADKIPTFLYGCYKGFAYSFYNLVPTVTSVIGISVLPNLASAWVKHDKSAIKDNIESVLRMTAILAVPVGFGISALAKPVLTMFYSSQPSEVAVSSGLLVWLGLAGVAAGIAMPVTSMLQAIDRQMIPVINIIIGIVVKLILNAVLVMIPQININGAAYSTLACYALVLLLDVISLLKYSGVRVNIWSTLLKPILSGTLCSVAAMTSFGLISSYFGVTSNVKNCIFVFAAIVLGGIIYIFSLLLLRTITKNDLKMLPQGEKIVKVLEKFKVLG